MSADNTSVSYKQKPRRMKFPQELNGYVFMTKASHLDGGHRLWEGWAPPCDIGQDTSHEDDNQWYTGMTQNGNRPTSKGGIDPALPVSRRTPYHQTIEAIGLAGQHLLPTGKKLHTMANAGTQGSQPTTSYNGQLWSARQHPLACTGSEGRHPLAADDKVSDGGWRTPS